MSGTELMVRQTGAIDPYTPRDYSQALQMAGTLGKAAGLTAEEAFLKMATGAEYGIPATTALRQIDIIPGLGGTKQIGLRAQLMVALCQRQTAICEYIEHVEGDDKSATWRAKRAGRDEQRETYTIDQAKKAKLVKDGGAWEKDPATMLIARASARLARRVFPDILGGVYTPDELREASYDEPRDVTPPDVRPLTPAAPKPAPVVDAVIVEPESDEAKAARMVARLDAATTEAERAAAVADANAMKLPKGPARESVAKAATAAKDRIAAAAATQAVLDLPAREPGSDDE